MQALPFWSMMDSLVWLDSSPELRWNVNDD